jgi:hypothetical protein
MCAVKLRDFPPRLGFTRQAEEKSKSLDQFYEDAERCRMAWISFVRKLAAAGRAPLGMRLRMLLLLPDRWMTTASSGKDWAGGVDTSVAVDMVVAVVVINYIKCKKRYRFKKAMLYEREVIKKQKFFIRRQKLPYSYNMW